MYKALTEIADALSRIQDPSLIERFLGGLLTKSELKRIALRWRLSKELYHGKSQRKIAEELGVSLCKITRGSRELKKEKSALKRVIAESLSRACLAASAKREASREPRGLASAKKEGPLS